ncbi:hypothetical protein AB4144_07000 [Rhizobiaceae sp. 2RAB30]
MNDARNEVVGLEHSEPKKIAEEVERLEKEAEKAGREQVTTKPGAVVDARPG